MPSDFAVMKAASAWTQPSTQKIEMDCVLGTAFAEIIDEILNESMKKYCMELFNRGFIEGMNEVQYSRGGKDFNTVWPTTKAFKRQ